MTTFVRDLLIARRAVGNERGWCFPGSSRGGNFTDCEGQFAQIAACSGIRVSAHDLRRTFVTIAETTDICPMALKALVNHSLGSDVTSGYNIQLSVERLREPAERVCQRIKELCQIEEREGIEKLGAR